MIALMALLQGCASAADPQASEAPQSIPPEAAMVAQDCRFEVHNAETGYRLCLSPEGLWTESWPALPLAPRGTFEPTPPGRTPAQQWDALPGAWARLLGPHAGRTLGPTLADGTRAPNGVRVENHTLTFRAVEAAGGTVEVTVKGDLRVPASLGPLEAPWNALSHRIFGPRQ